MCIGDALPLYPFPESCGSFLYIFFESCGSLFFSIIKENQEKGDEFRRRISKPYSVHLPKRREKNGEKDDSEGTANQGDGESRFRVVGCGEIRDKESVDSDEEEGPEVQTDALLRVVVESLTVFAVKESDKEVTLNVYKENNQNRKTKCGENTVF